MGLQESRMANNDVLRETNFCNEQFWLEPDYKDEFFNHEGPFMSEQAVRDAGICSGCYFKNIQTKIKILEIGAGNGKNSKVFITNFANKVENVEYKGTDLFSYPNPEMEVESGLDSKTAVERYGADRNVLLMISPPPKVYVDLYAIRPFELMDGVRYLIFVGELGASDGGEGMYNYLMTHPVWKLEERKMLVRSRDIFGGPCEKELFIFKKN